MGLGVGVTVPRGGETESLFGETDDGTPAPAPLEVESSLLTALGSVPTSVEWKGLNRPGIVLRPKEIASFTTWNQPILFISAAGMWKRRSSASSFFKTPSQGRTEILKSLMSQLGALLQSCL